MKNVNVEEYQQDVLSRINRYLQYLWNLAFECSKMLTVFYIVKYLFGNSYVPNSITSMFIYPSYFIKWISYFASGVSTPSVRLWKSMLSDMEPDLQHKRTLVKCSEWQQENSRCLDAHRPITMVRYSDSAIQNWGMTRWKYTRHRRTVVRKQPNTFCWVGMAIVTTPPMASFSLQIQNMLHRQSRKALFIKWWYALILKNIQTRSILYRWIWQVDTIAWKRKLAKSH